MSLSRFRSTQVESRLPLEIIFEILERVTVETLDTCKFVSKEWRNLISGNEFHIAYSRRNNNFIGYFVQDITHDHYYPSPRLHKSPIHPPIFVSLSEQDNGRPSAHNWGFSEALDVLASCKQGILFCRQPTRDAHNYFIVKPAVSRKWSRLPEPDHSFYYHYFGIVVLESNPLWFKVVCLLKLFWYSKRFHYQVFDSKLWKWGKRGATEMIDWPMLVISDDNAVSISGSIYWQTYNTRYSHVLAFNGLDESICMFPLPDQVMNENGCYNYIQIQELGGILALVGVRKMIGCGLLELWKMKDSVNHQWSEKMKVTVQIKRCHFKGLYDQEIIYSKLLDEIVIYKYHPMEDFCRQPPEVHYRIYPFGHDLSII